MAKTQLLSVKALALAGGCTWALFIFLIGLAAMSGWGAAFVNAFGQLYIGYRATVLGALIGAVWAFVDGLIGCAVFAWLYNYFAKKF